MMGQVVVAAPMLGLYLVSILIAWVVNPRSRRTRNAEVTINLQVLD